MTTRNDLTAERAAIALLEQMGLYGHPAASQFIGDILAALQTTRQEALREAKEEITSYLEKMGNKIPNSLVHRINMHERLDRLASEGG